MLAFNKNKTKLNINLKIIVIIEFKKQLIEFVNNELIIEFVN